MSITAQVPSQKKRKLSDDASDESSGSVSPPLSPEPETVKQTSLWFDDGSVVLQAEQTQFRVHRSILAACSPIFRDMFSRSHSQNSDSEGTVEGCPVFYLQDSAEDLEFLLDGIYNHPNSYTPETADIVPIPFTMLSALLRLGNKYQVRRLRSNALYRLRAEYVPILDKLRLQDCFYYCPDCCGDAINFDIVTLADQEGVFSALPFALFMLAANYNTEEIFDGLDRKHNGTRATLSPAMLRACLEGRERLMESLSTVSYKWLIKDPGQPFSSCARAQSCNVFFHQLSRRIWLPIPNLDYCLDKSWDELIEEIPHPLCEECDANAREYHEEGRKALWEKLPSIFGFGSWEEVKKMDRC